VINIVSRITPKPNFGSKYPKEEGKLCYGVDLSKAERMGEVTMDYVIRCLQ